MKNLLYLFLLCSLCSCGQTSKSPFEEGTENYIRLKKDVVAKLNKWNPKSVNTGDFDINVNPLTQSTNYRGVYSYYATGSHHSGKNFFIYDGSNMRILNPTDTTTMKNEIINFLNKNKFTPDQEQECLKKVDKILSQKESSSF